MCRRAIVLKIFKIKKIIRLFFHSYLPNLNDLLDKKNEQDLPAATSTHKPLLAILMIEERFLELTEFRYFFKK